MSSINLIGNLLDPNGLFSVGDKVKFTHQNNHRRNYKKRSINYNYPPRWQLQSKFAIRTNQSRI